MPWKCQSAVPASQRFSPANTFFSLILMFVSNDKLCIVDEICSNLRIRFKIIGERLAPSRWMKKTVSYPLNLKAQLCSFKSQWYSEHACSNHEACAYIVFVRAPAALWWLKYQVTFSMTSCRKKKWHSCNGLWNSSICGWCVYNGAYPSRSVLQELHSTYHRCHCRHRTRVGI